jgi:hypothetical protein
MRDLKQLVADFGDIFLICPLTFYDPTRIPVEFTVYQQFDISPSLSCMSHSPSADGGWDKFHKKWPLIIFVSFGYLLKILLFHQSHDHYSAALIAVCFSSISSIALSV